MFIQTWSSLLILLRRNVSPWEKKVASREGNERLARANILPTLVTSNSMYEGGYPELLDEHCSLVFMNACNGAREESASA